MALTGSTIASTYLKLLRINTDTMGADATASYIQDSADTDSVLSISTTRVGIGNAAPASVLHLTGTMQVGVDGTGHDVIFYGDSPSSNMTWDESEDDLVLNDSRLYIKQDENAKCIEIDTESTSFNAITVDGCKYGIYVVQDKSDGRAGYFTRDMAEVGSQALISIVDNNDANTQDALFIQQDGAGKGINIDQNGNGNAIYIDTLASGNSGINIAGCKYGIHIEQTISNGYAAHFNRDMAEVGSQPLVAVIDNNDANTSDALFIQQDGSAKAINIDHNGNSNAIFIDSETTTSMSLDIQSDALTTGAIARFYSNSSDSGSARNLVVIQNDHTSADSATCLYILQQGDTRAGVFEAGGVSYGSEMLYLNATERSSDSGFSFLRTYTDGDNDIQHYLRGDGEAYADASWNSMGADYAEYFESKDGSKIEVGTTVKLDGDKIVACESGDSPLGVVRPQGCSSNIGNVAGVKWQGKYLKDDYGVPIKEEYSVTEWMEDTDEVKEKEVEAQDAVEAKDAVLYEEGDELPMGKEVGDEKEAAVEGKEAVEEKAAVYMHKDIQYHTDKIPDDVTVPDDATVTSTEKDGSKLMRKKLNPDYDESIEYESREDRDEWHIVGLLGQIPITKGQPMSDNWIKMKDVSDTVEMWFVK